jgi:hypothetical protein
LTRIFSLAVACAISLTLASVANASVTVGQLVTPNAGCGGAITILQTGVASGASYTVPSDGVITSWSVQDASLPITGLKLKVGRLVSGNQYSIVAESAAGPQTANSVNSYAAQIPVKAGDLIGESATGGTCGVNSSNTADSVVAALGDVPVGTMATFGPPFHGIIPVAANVEPDADGDGFGDETQDLCPTDASTHGPCPSVAVPVTPPAAAAPRRIPAVIAVIARVKKLSNRGSLSFTVADTENATGTATGTISLPKSARVVRFKTAKLKLNAGQSKKVTLHLSKSALKAVRKALRHHKLKVKITVTLNHTVKRLSTTLKR